MDRYTTKDFIYDLVEDGLDNNTIISFVQEQDEISRQLVLFLKYAMSQCIQGKPVEPHSVLQKALVLGLIEEKSEHIYGYTEAVKNASGEEFDTNNNIN